MPQLQYQQWAIPLLPVALDWLPTVPGPISARRSVVLSDLVEPILPIPTPPVPTFWAPTFPDQGAHRRDLIVSDLATPILPLATPVTIWTPRFPDQVPAKRLLQTTDLVEPLLPPSVAPLFWAPGFPDRVSPRPFRPLTDLVEPLLPLPSPTFRSSGSPQGYVLQINAGASGQYQTTLVGADGAPLPGELLTALLLTLYTIDQDNLDHIVNSRFKQNVFNTANVQMASSGTLTWTVQPADTTLVDPSVAFERHIGLFEWVVQGGGQGKHEVILVCQRAHLS